MEAYTQAHKASAGLDKAEREIRCLRTIFPALFRSIEDDDLLAGRLDFLPIGFGSVTSIGGVSHYCVFHKLRSFKEQLDSAEEKARVDALYAYWEEHDTKAIYCADVLLSLIHIFGVSLVGGLYMKKSGKGSRVRKRRKES